LVAGCGDDDDSSDSGDGAASSGTQTEKKAAKAPKIAVIYTVSSSDYQGAQEEGITKVVEREGGSFETFNANFDPQKLISDCQDAVSSGRFNAILLQTLAPPLGVPCVTAAKAANIPVVALNGAIGKDANSTEPQVDGVVGGVYSTPDDTAASAVELATEACKDLDPCNIIAEVASPNDPLTNESVAAVAKEVPNAKIVAKFASGFDPGQVAQKMPDLLSAHKDANVFLSIADSSALAAIPALKQAGMLGKVKLLGDGGSREGVKAVADGTMFGSSGNWPRQEGEITAEMAVKAINGEPIDPVGMLQSDIDDPDTLTKDTVGDFKPEWGSGR
jgi:ribose transport system substrate-binding protein